MTATARRLTASGLTAVLAAGLHLRLRFVLGQDYAPLEWDQLEYTKLAIQLLKRGIYAYRDTVPNTLVTPGWPMLLVVFFRLFGYDPLEPTLMIIRVFQCFLALGAIIFLYLTGLRLFGPATGLLAAGMAAVYPSYVWSASLILTEVPFLTCFTALLFVQVRILQDNRRRDHVLAGLLLGLCVLIRPNSLPLAFVPYLLLRMEKKRIEWGGAGLGIAAFAFVMMPWWVRNWLTFHEIILIAKGEAGNPFLGGTDPYFRRTIDWSKVNGKVQFAEGMRRIRQGLRDDPGLWLSWLTVGKFKTFFRTMWVGPYPFTVPGWYYELLVQLHRYIVRIGLLTALALAPWSRSVRFLALSLAVFLSVHMAFIPVDRYAYAMLPMLMLMAAHFATGGAAVLWAACKQAGRSVLARR
jgi:4-amino-4-deoxy-L-arabinose transferase-like glycosyltransferase